MSDKITFFKSYYEAVKDLPAELQAEIYTAIFSYAFEDVVPVLSPVAGAIFKLILPVLDKSKTIRENGKENGSRGGRPRNNQDETKTETEINQQETEINQEKTQTKPNENPNKTKIKPKRNQSETQTKAGIGIGIGEGIGKGIGIGEGEGTGTGKRKKEKEIIKGPDGLPVLLKQSGLSSEILPAVSDYIEMRKKIKAPLTDRAISLMLTKLGIMSKDPEEQIQILNQSTMNSWKGIFPVKQEQQKKSRAAEELDAFYKMAAGWAAESEGAS